MLSWYVEFMKSSISGDCLWEIKMGPTEYWIRFTNGNDVFHKYIFFFYHFHLKNDFASEIKQIVVWDLKSGTSPPNLFWHKGNMKHQTLHNLKQIKLDVQHLSTKNSNTFIESLSVLTLTKWFDFFFHIK